MISIPGRIPIFISPFFWLLIFVIGWLNSGTLIGTAVWATVILISILIHEYGHALTALMFGQEAEINLIGLGGMTKRNGPKLDHWKEFLIVFNGPFAGILTFLAANMLLNHFAENKTILVYFLIVAVNVNLFWTLLNLLPVLPLDGGHLLRIILEKIFGFRGYRWSFLVSMILACAIGILSFLSQQVIMGALFLMLAFEGYRAWADIKEMLPEDENKELQEWVQEGMKDLEAGRLSEALQQFEAVRQRTSKGMLYVTATQYGARILAEQGNFKLAYLWLYPLKSRLSPEYLRLLQQLSYRLQEWEETVKIGELLYQQEPSIDAAVTNALSYGILGQAVPAVGWLRCAVQLGLKNVDQIIEKREFDAIRQSDPFQKWLRSH